MRKQRMAGRRHCGLHRSRQLCRCKQQAPSAQKVFPLPLALLLAASCCSEAGLRHLSALPLRTLVLSACCQLTDGCLLAISESLPRLACLGIFEAGEEVTDVGLAHLAGLASSLTALDVGYSCWDHTAAGLAALLAQLPRLQMLNIGGWARLPAA
jgi:hypothetical protein